MSSKYYSLLFLILIITYLLTPSSLFAAGKGSLEVNPAYQEIVLEKPNEEKSIEITYINSSTVPLSLDVYPIDFKQQGERGGISFLGKDSASYSYSLSSFLVFESNTLELAPGEQKKLRIKVLNRDDISPGGHYAAIIARQTQGDRSTTVSPAVSSLIFMRKSGGERFNLSIQKINWPRFPVVFSFPSDGEVTFQNAGNVHVVPYGTVVVKDIFGRAVYKGVLNTSSVLILPESRRHISFSLRNVAFLLPLSFNSLQIKGTDSLQKVTYVHEESFLSINPYLFIVFPLILIVFISRRKNDKGVSHRRLFQYHEQKTTSFEYCDVFCYSIGYLFLLYPDSPTTQNK